MNRRRPPSTRSRHYTETIPACTATSRSSASRTSSARASAPITTPAEHFAEWKTTRSETMPARPQLEVMIEGVFAPARFLELIRDFVLFETDGARTWKVMAKYHQVARGQRCGRVGRAGDGRRPARRAGLAHAGRRQELHDGVLRQQAAARPAVREPDDRRRHRPHRPRQPARRHVHRHRTSPLPASRRRRSPAARRACTSC